MSMVLDSRISPKAIDCTNTAESLLPQGYRLLASGETVRRSDLIYLQGKWQTTPVFSTKAVDDGNLYARHCR